jgi:hypothetical protein
MNLKIYRLNNIALSVSVANLEAVTNLEVPSFFANLVDSVEAIAPISNGFTRSFYAILSDGRLSALRKDDSFIEDQESVCLVQAPVMNPVALDMEGENAEQ